MNPPSFLAGGMGEVGPPSLSGQKLGLVHQTRTFSCFTSANGGGPRRSYVAWEPVPWNPRTASHYPLP